GGPFLGMVVLSLILSIAGFWCASVLKGTLRAVLWVFPSIFIAAWFYRLGVIFGGPFGLLGTSPLMSAAISRFHPYPFTNATEMFLFHITTPRVAVIFLAATVIPFVIFQSYRQFRRESCDSAVSSIRCLVPLLLLILACGFVQLLPVTFMEAVAR